MRVGCDLPYFSDPGEIRAFAEGVEALGYHHLGFSEHVAASGTTAYPPGFSFDDPWHETTTLVGFLAAVTSNVELNPAMLLVTLRHPVLIAKQLAELDLLTSGRLRVGVSVGWNREEQVSLGVDPATRGDRLDELVPLLRRLWSEDEVTFHGEHVSIERVGIHPRPRRPIPIWIGGGGLGYGGQPPERALRRAAKHGDGFKLMAPTGIDPDNAIALAERLHEYAAEEGRSIEVEGRLITQVTPPDEWASVMRRYRESGLFSHVGLGNRIAGGTVDQQLALVRDVLDRTREEWG
jgi:probable F420-dependent oxidoreductase